VDVLLGVLAVVRQIKSGQPAVANEYRRAVRPEGNPVALSLMEEVFETFDAEWRGLGVIPASGLKLKPEWVDFEATRRFELSFKPQRLQKTDCRCGEVLKGLINPPDCPLFGKICNPDHPLGPCMVSYEGACLIEYRYSSGVKWK
jgi:Hydrogenase maturation factor